MRGISTKKLIPILAVVILLAVLVPGHQTKADCFTMIPVPSLKIDDCVVSISNVILNFLGNAIGYFAGLLDSFIKYQTDSGVYNVTVVDQSWTIIRDFVNMFFILVLIIMAFGTIFDIKKYTWREMLAPFLIAALLVNFSLTIGQYIITVSNGLASIFLNTIQQAGGVSNTFASGTGIVKTMSSGATTTNLVAGSLGIVATAIFAIIFLTVVFLAFAAVAIFSIVRLFMLWFLLIISPIAWIGYTLPNLRSKTWGDWWKQFFCWCFFLPYFLFFMMFAVMFVMNKNSFKQVPGNVTMAGMALNDLMFYILSLIFLIGGMIVAKKMACASGTGLKTVFGKIEGGVRKYAPGAAYVRGGVAGLKARGEEIQEKGVLGIGGAQRARIAEAGAKELFAFGAARGAADRAKAEEIEKESKKVRELNLDQRGLNERVQSTKGVERVAAFKLKAENGWLDPKDIDEIISTIRGLGGRSAAGTSFIKALEKGKFHEMAKGIHNKEQIFARLEREKDADVGEVTKAFARDMAESGELSEDLALKLLGLYEGEALEEKEKVDNAVKKNLKNFVRTKDERRDFLLDASKDKRLRKLLAGQMSEDGEINTYQKYGTAVELFEGEKEAKSIEMLAKIAKDDPLTHAEIQFRQDLGLTDAHKLETAYTPTAIEMGGLLPRLEEKMKKMGAKQISEAEKEKWTVAQFGEALQNKVTALEATEPTIPEIPRGTPGTPQGRKEIPGAGKRFIESLKKGVGGDSNKLAVVTGLRV